jgi:hypothetical protein
MNRSEVKQARQELPGGMPSREYVVETRLSESDYEQDAWIEIQTAEQLWHIVQGWART